MTEATQRQLHLGAILEGVGADHSSWLDPDLPGDASIDIDWYIDNARAAEAAKFDLVFIVDSPYITPDTAPHFLNRLEPLTLLSAVAASTSRIGLVGTLTTSYCEPYNVARQFGSLDQISRGRAGWNVVTTGLEGAARNYGREEHFDHQLRYARAREFVDVVQGLWDSYEDDAFPRDRAAGIFLDKSKQHRLDHKGTHFSVAGPLALSRSAQGQPVIFQAGDSNEGRNLGASIAEGTFTSAEDFETGRAYYADIKARAGALGRNPDHLKILPGLVPIIAETDEEAQAIAAAQQQTLDIGKLLVQVGRAFNYHDFPLRSGCTLPRPVRRDAEQLQGPCRADHPGRAGGKADAARGGLSFRPVAVGLRGIARNHRRSDRALVHRPRRRRFPAARDAAEGFRPVPGAGGADPAGARPVPRRLCASDVARTSGPAGAGQPLCAGAAGHRC
ncbi:FMN-dependent oxidoreductase, nitrilotriacetate monooxygenase family [Sphingobium chlorophenolicum L-1]|uniref:FMN-dependent oxidoreductase, nitrilotriacetate monooxygenase family n=1 Tax=Sphingobium chlorophenolicum L-1 TaxID=690566 RepID=F6F151_SPHCR|nr:FMN-dependent oxidoreductase, nitrilotriacetate monooxygenase family [Sphingobium chlorophenolicum L-1]